MENYEQIINALQNEILGSKKSILGGGRAIDEGRCNELINLLKDNMPQELTEARYILRDRDDIISSAKAQAEEIISSAVDKANHLVYDSEIVRRASIDADNIRRDAEDYSSAIERETRLALNDNFTEAENSIANILSMIRDCRDDLMGESLQRPKA